MKVLGQAIVSLIVLLNLICGLFIVKEKKEEKVKRVDGRSFLVSIQVVKLLVKKHLVADVNFADDFSVILLGWGIGGKHKVVLIAEIPRVF